MSSLDVNPINPVASPVADPVPVLAVNPTATPIPGTCGNCQWWKKTGAAVKVPNGLLVNFGLCTLNPSLYLGSGSAPSSIFSWAQPLQWVDENCQYWHA